MHTCVIIVIKKFKTILLCNRFYTLFICWLFLHSSSTLPTPRIIFQSHLVISQFHFDWQKYRDSIRYVDGFNIQSLNCENKFATISLRNGRYVFCIWCLFLHSSSPTWHIFRSHLVISPHAFQLYIFIGGNVISNTTVSILTPFNNHIQTSQLTNVYFSVVVAFI